MVFLTLLIIISKISKHIPRIVVAPSFEITAQILIVSEKYFPAQKKT